MERCGKMDATRGAYARIPLIRTAWLLFLLTGGVLFCRAANSPQDCSPERIKQQASQELWREIAGADSCGASSSPDVQFFFGTALAKLERWQEAEKAFLRGQALAPRDRKSVV